MASDETVQHEVVGGQAVPPPQEPAGGPEPATPASAQAATVPSAFDERPEVYVGAAFAGGLLFAMIVRKIRS